MYFFEKGLKNYSYSLYKEKIFIKDVNTSYHLITPKNLFYKKVNGKIIKLNYTQRSEIINLLINNKKTKIEIIKIYTVDINGHPLQFEVDLNKNIKFFQDISFFKFNKLPEFIKEKHISYHSDKNEYYDIEWTGENYQAEHYLSKFYFIENCSELIKNQINEYEAILYKIPKDINYYKKIGFEICIIDSSKRYPAFKYSFEIKSNKDKDFIYKPYGISNVFDVQKDAELKAIYSLWFHFFLKNPLDFKDPLIEKICNEIKIFKNS